MATTAGQRCSHCQGALRRDEDELVCMTCGRRYQVKRPEAPVASEGIEIVVTLKPTNLSELYSAMATARDYSSAREYLQSKGLSQGAAQRMIMGDGVDVKGLLAVVEDSGITGADLLKLMRATAAARPRPAANRPPPSSKTCQACGAANGNRARKCQTCGAFFQAGGQTAEPGQQENQE